MPRRRTTRAVATAVALTGVLVWSLRPAGPGDPDRLRVTFLDVGQGDATLVETADATVLVDAGPPEGPVLERLRRAGVDRIDVLVATHGSTDHVGGAGEVVRRLDVGLLLDGGGGERNAATAELARAVRERGVRRLATAEGQRLRVGDLRVDVLWPRPGVHEGEDPNLRATVLVATAHGRRVLLTADAESEVLARLPLPAVDVLKVPHHGSADPGLPAVLARTRPRVAGIPVGRRNSYGHPAPSTVAALARQVPEVVRTDRDGTVRLDLRADGWEVRRGD